MELIKPGTRIDFMRQRRFWIILSTVLAVVSLILALMPENNRFHIPSPNYGTDFRGGTELQVLFKRPVDVSAVRAAVESIPGFSRPDVVATSGCGGGTAGDGGCFLIRVQEVSAITPEQGVKVRSALCYRGSTSDDKGNTTEDPELDPSRCQKDVDGNYQIAPGVPAPTEVKFSPGGDKLALRFEVKPGSTMVVPEHKDGNVQVPASLSKDGEAKVREALNSTEPKIGVRGARDVNGLDRDFEVKAKDLSQAQEVRVEVQLKSKGDDLLDKLREKTWTIDGQSVPGVDVVPMAAEKVEWVGPRAGKQLRDAAVKSVMFAIIFIMAYVAFRFDLRFAPGGILALIHDALVVIGVFVITHREISLTTIAAILTIVGYSISDTVIIYDRIRENLSKHRGKTFHEIINLSVSETLSRTILTSGSVLLSVAAFFIWGTGVIKDFALALFVGVIAGTYSSIFVAAPLTEWIDRKWFGSTATKGKRAKRTVQGPGGAKRQAQHQL